MKRILSFVILTTSVIHPAQSTIINTVGDWKIDYNGTECSMIKSRDDRSTISISLSKKYSHFVDLFISDPKWVSLKPGGAVDISIGRKKIPGVELPGPLSGFMSNGHTDYSTSVGNASLDDFRSNTIVLENKGRHVYAIRFGSADQAAFNAVAECAKLMIDQSAH